MSDTNAPIRHGAVLVIIMTSYLMIVIDISIVITGLPKIQAGLGFSPAGLSWVQNAYTLAFGGLLLLGARAGDLLGRRRMFIVGLGLFTAASLAIGLAATAAWLITARAVQGVGAAILAPSTLALLSTHFPEGPERTRALGWYGATAGIPPATYACSNGLAEANNYGGLNLSNVPKVLFETANMRSATDASLITQPAVRQRIAQGIALGLARYLAG